MPKYGTVGTIVIFYVNSPFTLEGNYSILWGTSSLFNEGTFVVLKEGKLQRSTTASVSFQVPETAYGGPYFVQFFQPAHEGVNDQFTVMPSISVSPASAKPGTTVIVKGMGFPSNDKGAVKLKNNLATAPFSTNSKGSFNVELDLPELELGIHELTATSTKLGTASATASIDILSRSDQPQPTVTPQNPQPTVTPQNPTTVNVPAKSKMNLPKPVIIAPRDDSIGWFGKQTVTFQWGAVSGYSGISYEFEVGENFNFDPPLTSMQKSNLNSTHYVLRLSPGTYYWRVKATDTQGNAGDWSYSPYPFKVGSFPMGLVIAVIAVVAVLIFVARKLKKYIRPDSSQWA